MSSAILKLSQEILSRIVQRDQKFREDTAKFVVFFFKGVRNSGWESMGH